jgi:hypothetical protein
VSAALAYFSARSLWKARQACVKDPVIGDLVARADVLGPKPSDGVLAPEMVRLFGSLTKRHRNATSRISAGNRFNTITTAMLPLRIALAA